MAPAVRGKRRCRMHGGTNLGRPRDPKVQLIKHGKIVRIHIRKNCQGCNLINKDCPKVFGGKSSMDDLKVVHSKYHPDNQFN